MIPNVKHHNNVDTLHCVVNAKSEERWLQWEKDQLRVHQSQHADNDIFHLHVYPPRSILDNKMIPLPSLPLSFPAYTDAA
jgi:Zn-dependent M16 (insulinase) family peptidase